MALNIKDEETHQLASRLATITGESLTLAVKVAVKERLERQEKATGQRTRLERIREIVNRTAPRMNDGRTSRELIEELYDDETGLPR